MELIDRNPLLKTLIEHSSYDSVEEIKQVVRDKALEFQWLGGLLEAIDEVIVAPAVTAAEQCEDAVSRLGAINHFRGIADATSSKEKYNEGFVDGLEFCIAHLSTMPPVTPKQRTGKWIDGIIPNDSGGLPVIVCDQCNTFFPLQFGDGHNFCPNCGAKMEL